MPHTSRRKNKQQPKRVEVVDEDGWTRITTTDGGRHAPRPGRSQTSLLGLVNGGRTVPEAGVTLESLSREYRTIRDQWLASTSCQALKTLLVDRVLRDDVQIDRCIVFGTGSFSGLREGWISRRQVAMCQLAVLQTMKETIGENTTQRPSLHAQDPAYNDLDVEFLTSLDVLVEQVPDGFDLVAQKSLVYTPCAELHVEMEVLTRRPSILLTGRLDWFWRNEQGRACTSRQGVCAGSTQVSSSVTGNSGDDSREREAPAGRLRVAAAQDLERDYQAFERFVGRSNQAPLPSLDVKDHPFTEQYLYWLEADERDGDSAPNDENK